MADKAVELLDKVIADQDYDAFVKDTFVAKRTNPAVLNKVKDGITFRLQSTKVPDASKVILRQARDVLQAYLVRLSNHGTVAESYAKTQAHETKLDRDLLEVLLADNVANGFSAPSF